MRKFPSRPNSRNCLWSWSAHNWTTNPNLVIYQLYGRLKRHGSFNNHNFRSSWRSVLQKWNLRSSQIPTYLSARTEYCEWGWLTYHTTLCSRNSHLVRSLNPTLRTLHQKPLVCNSATIRATNNLLAWRFRKIEFDKMRTQIRGRWGDHKLKSSNDRLTSTQASLQSTPKLWKASITAVPRSINLSMKTYNLRVSNFGGRNGEVWTKADERGKEEEESLWAWHYTKLCESSLQIYVDRTRIFEWCVVRLDMCSKGIGRRVHNLSTILDSIVNTIWGSRCAIEESTYMYFQKS